MRYGGNTSCVAVSGKDDRWRLVLDGGTGLRRFSEMLGGGPFRGTVLLSHLHWDHTHGIPFFGAASHPASEVSVALPAQGRPAVDLLEDVIGPPHFPVGPRELAGHWHFADVDSGLHDMEGFSVLARDIPHPGGRTFGYRVRNGSGVIAYLSDHMPLAEGAGPDGLGAYHPAALELIDGADLVIHDAQHLASELPAKGFLGHSAAEYAVGLAREGGARKVLLFHHDPDRTDDEIDAIVGALRSDDVEVEGAVEGRIIDVD